MQKRIVNGVEVRRSSGNVFADLGVPDADKLKVKTELAIAIRTAMKVLGPTQTETARRMGISHATVSDMMRGDFTNLTERKLMKCLKVALAWQDVDWDNGNIDN